MYKVINVYGIYCKSPCFRKLDRAIRFARSMSGDGWIVVDMYGKQVVF